ncbi:MAG: hypothetical protein FD180_3054 [Planctomycetota bacterium]|nr:MAG: hypothetical protein FD180_3054 [Planctomycetota bacterium]
MKFLIAAVLLLAASSSRADEDPLYKSSVVGTDFDFILDSDPDTFVDLKSLGEGKAEMPDKSDNAAPLVKSAFLFVSNYKDGTSIDIAVDIRFEKEELARKEALRYTPRLGKLPTVLRRGVSRLVIHKGGEDTTGFSDVGLIVLYSDNATRRIGTHDLEETVFHESVHAAWDKEHRESPTWLEAQKKDGCFVTEYARKNPKGEDLAESALFAYTLVHHPERIPKDHAERIRRAIPARIVFVEKLLPAGKPIHFVACRVDLTNPDTLSDVLSNALVGGLEKDEAKVQAFLKEARGKYSKAEDLFKAAMDKFGVPEATLRAKVEEFRHCNCKHGDLEGRFPREE